MQLFTILKYLLHLLLVSQCIGEEPVKSRFQVEHKSGKLNIMATKESADIESAADFVDVVMKPGEQQMEHGELDERHHTPKTEDSSKGGNSAGDADKKSPIEDERHKFFDFKEGWIKPPVKPHKKEPAENKALVIEKGLIELETEAAQLADKILYSAKNESAIETIKGTAKQLEEKVEELNKSFASPSEAEISDKGIGQVRNFTESGTKDGTSPVSGASTASWTKDGASNETSSGSQQPEDGKPGKTSAEDEKASESKKKKPSCPGCQKIPKPGDKPSENEQELVPKLSADVGKSIGESSFAKDSEKTDEKKDSSQSEDSSGSEKKPSCPGCQKIPKPGDKPDENGQEIVPKLSKGEEKGASGFVDNADKEEGKAPTESEKGKPSKPKKPSCPGCQKIPKPSDKPDENEQDGVPKLSKDEEKSVRQDGTNNTSSANDGFDLADAEPSSEEKKIMGNMKAINTSYVTLSDLKSINKTSGDRLLPATSNSITGADVASFQHESVQTGRIPPNLDMNTDSPISSKEGSIGNRSSQEHGKVKNFEKVLGKFLNGLNNGEKEELLKLTWHDLRNKQLHTVTNTSATVVNATADNGNKDSVEKIDKGVKVANISESNNSESKDKLGSSSEETLIDGPVDTDNGAVTRNDNNTAANNDNGAVTSTTEFTNWMKTFVGRLKKKISLLRDVVEGHQAKSKAKSQYTLQKKSPYEGFRRQGISNKMDWLNAKMERVKLH